jgi:hypothetical protein
MVPRYWISPEKAAMDSHYFPEKKPNPDVAKVTVFRAPALFCFRKEKVLTANKK